MSYILDALRKADSDRERGSVPTIHSQPTHSGSDSPSAPVSSTKPWVWGVVGGGVVLLVGGVVWGVFGGDAAPVAPVVDAASVAVSPAMPAPVAVVEPSPRLAERAPEPSPALAPAPALQRAPEPEPVLRREPALQDEPVPAPAAPAPAVPAARLLVPPPVRPSTPVAATPPHRSSTKADVAVPATASPDPAPEARLYAMHELPEAIRRAIPSMTVGGAMYSETPASRMLILNGQVFHEGDRPGPDLVLEQIKLKSAVLSYKGYRYGISY